MDVKASLKWSNNEHEHGLLLIDGTLYRSNMGLVQTIICKRIVFVWTMDF